MTTMGTIEYSPKSGRLAILARANKVHGFTRADVLLLDKRRVLRIMRNGPDEALFALRCLIRIDEALQQGVDYQG